jgi:hypothetical protein
MQNIAGYSVGLFTEVTREVLAPLANLSWKKLLADLGLLVVGLLTCSLLSRGTL